MFIWENGDIKPGEEFGCRCVAEPLSPEAAPNPNEVQVAVLDKLAFIVAAAKILAKVGSKVKKLPKKIPKEPPVKPTPKPVPKSPVGKSPPVGGRKNVKWQLGNHKSEIKWKNRMEQRGWSNEKIDDTIKNGQEYPAPNNVRKEYGATATRYEKDGKFVVRDDKTGDILQISNDKFIPQELP